MGPLVTQRLGRGKMVASWIGLMFILVFTSVVRSGGASVRAAAVEAGYRDFVYSATGVSAPTAEKPQSKLWFNDGIWWGCLFNRTTETYNIFRFNWDSQTWSDTGTVIDDRNNSKADGRWDGTYLYIASAGKDSATTTDSARLLRYSYNSSTKRYSLDSGFPVNVSSGGMEAVVLDKDSRGTLWVTYTQNSRVYINRSTTSDQTWGTPFVPPAQGTSVAADDISALIAARDYIAVLWSNQNTNAIHFAIHRDGDSSTSWVLSGVALQGTAQADDHLNIKSLQADSSGAIFAVIKTGANDAANPDPNAPLIRVLIGGADGRWRNSVFGRVADNHTRPMLLIDQQQREMYVFATAPEIGGTIYYKKASLDNIAFPVGRGTPFIQSSSDTRVNNVTSTKQNLNSATGLLVLASDDTSGYYLHNSITLGATTPSATPTSTTAPTVIPGTYAAKVRGTSGLVSYWRLGEKTGTSAADQTTANPGTIVAPVTLGVAGAIRDDTDTAMEFDGTTARVSAPDATSLNITGDLSVEAWVKPGVVSTVAQAVIGKGTGSSADTRQYRIGMSSGNWRGSIYIGTTPYSVDSTTAPAPGVWQHLVMVRSGSTLTLYVDGKATSVQTVPATGASNVTTGSLGIGRINPSADSQPFTGTIDEVALYNVALTPNQVYDHYATGATPQSPGETATATSTPTESETATTTPSPTRTATATRTPSPTRTSTPIASLRISDLRVDGGRDSRNKKYAWAIVQVVDASNRPVRNATIDGSWSGAYSGSMTATTNSDGIAIFRTPARSSRSSLTFTFKTTRVRANNLTWDGVNRTGTVTVR